MGEENAISKEELNAEFLVGPVTIAKFPNSVSRLSLNDRILHLIVAYKIRPFGIEHVLVTLEEMWFMYHI
ncbi:Uncharacterized protein TCM_013608 [Theobroma cacao]|uniref:Uncharacterized protein n=1 Tax=Theobroma cacao TaxID=3641 RepID=A0A061FVS2_THECC|nr:Uncharacterized protein TCM_013608 [Theobroma cacao]